MTSNKPNYSTINALLTRIASCRIQLESADNYDEIDKICASVVAVEAKITEERRKELKIIQIKKDEVLGKITALEAELDDINRELNAKIAKYRESMTTRILQIETEINAKKSVLDPPTLE